VLIDQSLAPPTGCSVCPVAPQGSYIIIISDVI